jgi:hypothetical protein
MHLHRLVASSISMEVLIIERDECATHLGVAIEVPLGWRSRIIRVADGTGLIGGQWSACSNQPTVATSSGRSIGTGMNSPTLPRVGRILAAPGRLCRAIRARATPFGFPTECTREFDQHLHVLSFLQGGHWIAERGHFIANEPKGIDSLFRGFWLVVNHDQRGRALVYPLEAFRRGRIVAYAQ